MVLSADLCTEPNRNQLLNSIFCTDRQKPFLTLSILTVYSGTSEIPNFEHLRQHTLTDSFSPVLVNNISSAPSIAFVYHTTDVESKLVLNVYHLSIVFGSVL